MKKYISILGFAILTVLFGVLIINPPKISAVTSSGNASANQQAGQALEIALIAGIGCVGNQLTQEDIAVGVDGVDHQVHQFFAFGFELVHSHNKRTSLYLYELALF